MENQWHKMRLVGLGGLELPTKHYQLLASEVPEVSKFVCTRLVSANSRLNFNKTVSTPSSLLEQLCSLNRERRWARLHSNMRFSAQEGRASGTGETMPVASR